MHRTYDKIAASQMRLAAQKLPIVSSGYFSVS